MKNTTEIAMVTSDEITTIRIKKQVREELSKLGSYNETMSDIIARLIDFYKKSAKK
jgi:hypothetical protein